MRPTSNDDDGYLFSLYARPQRPTPAVVIHAVLKPISVVLLWGAGRELTEVAPRSRGFVGCVPRPACCRDRRLQPKTCGDFLTAIQ